MKLNFFGATAFALVLASSAYAADVSYAPVASSHDWSGFYVGVNAGIGGGTADHPISLVDPAGPTTIAEGSIDISGNGFVGGVQVGYNMQSGSLIWGIEGDIQLANIDHRVSASFTDGTNTLNASAGTELDWFATIRARLGTSVTDRMMAYVTGGVAYGKTSSSIDASLNGTPLFEASTSSNGWGWTVGAGAEYAFTEQLSLKTEYLYTDLGKETLVAGNLGGVDASLSRDYSFHTVRVGLNFKF